MGMGPLSRLGLKLMRAEQRIDDEGRGYVYAASLPRACSRLPACLPACASLLAFHAPVRLTRP